MLKAIGRAVTVLAYLAGGILLILVLLSTADVFMRHIFNAPIRGTLEMSELMLASVVTLSFAYTQTKKGHIGVTILSSRFSPRLQIFANLSYLLIGTCVASLVVWRTIERAIRSAEMGCITPLLKLPIYPVQILFMFGFTILVVVLIIDCIGLFSKLLRQGQLEQ